LRHNPFDAAAPTGWLSSSDTQQIQASNQQRKGAPTAVALLLDQRRNPFKPTELDGSRTSFDQTQSTKPTSLSKLNLTAIASFIQRRNPFKPADN
jgi:hypothetical protein